MPNHPGAGRPPAITAYSACNGMGTSTSAVIDSLSSSRTGLGIPPFSLPFSTHSGFIRGDLPAPPSHLEVFGTRQAEVALLALEGIQEEIGRAIRRWGSGRVAVIMATSTGGIADSECAYRAYKENGRLPDWYDYKHQHGFYAFTELLRHVTGAEGPAYVLSTACSSSGKVLGSARRFIQAGVADAVVVGGVDTLAETTLHGFHSLGVLSSDPCRPFDVDRSGMNIGEGGAMLLVEKDGDAVALLLGVGESSDASHMSTPHPQGLGARRAMEGAMKEAGARASDVDHINAHGTGTKLNDVAEAKAILGLFGGEVPVVSTKGFTGHLLGAAGATEAVFGVVAIAQSWIPASLGAENIDPDVQVAVNTKRREHRCRMVLSNSFGFGGSNVSVLLGAP